jgi:TNF receptor-associated factor 4
MAMEGGYDHTFVDPLPDELTCMVCHHVAREAHQVECCGKVFCKACITEANERIGTCPNCRKASPKIFSDLRGAREIKRLKITCKNEDKGCDWSGALESYETHEEECGWEEVVCPNFGCHEKILKRFIEEHLSVSCPRRKEKCSVCLEMVAYEDMPSHPDRCPNVEVECSNLSCSVKLFRGELEVHQNICPKQKISCPYSEAGCSAEILREDRQKHMLENIEHHATIANATVLSLKRELSNVCNQLESTLETKLVPPVTFRLTNYKRMKEKKEIWRSPCFYTHAQGYKMRLKVEINSQEDTAKDAVALYCYLGPGIYDDFLSWPFRGEMTLQILNQSRDYSHHSQILQWHRADDEVAGKPDKNKRSSSWGFAPYISHADLEEETKGYLKNDCIYIRVQKVSFPKQWLACSIIASNEPSSILRQVSILTDHRDAA